MQPNATGSPMGPAAEIEDRCKHDLLPGSCGFSQAGAGEAAPPPGPQLTAWLASFAHESLLRCSENLLSA
jgi:hypothetical protein